MLCNQSTVGEEAGTNTGLWLEPTRAVVCGKDMVVGAMARSAAIGTQWTQSRVAAAGYADKDDNKCKLCNAAEGTIEHRQSHEGCALLADRRKEVISDLDIAFINTHSPKMLLSRGLMLSEEKPSSQVNTSDLEINTLPLSTVPLE